MRSYIKVIITLVILIVLSRLNTQAQFKCELTNDPDEVKLIYDDIQNFLRAIKGLDMVGDSETFFKKEYLDKTSPGFKESTDSISIL